VFFAFKKTVYKFLATGYFNPVPLDGISTTKDSKNHERKNTPGNFNAFLGTNIACQPDGGLPLVSPADLSLTRRVQALNSNGGKQALGFRQNDRGYKSVTGGLTERYHE
jgi:hypothetical protein